jgi:transcriptional regulator with XRE-family HTH domain
MTTAPESTPWQDVPELAQAAHAMTFGRLMRSFRHGEEWTQDFVAQKLGFSKQMVSQLETGKRVPSLSEAVRIAHALDMPIASCIRLCLQAQIAQAGIVDQYDVEVRLKTAG